MASFTARWSEIEKEFEDAYQKAIEAQEPQEVVLANKIRIIGVLAAYIDLRNRAMEDGLKLLAETSSSYTEKGQDERWTLAMQKAGQDGFKMISDLDDDEDSVLNVTLLKIATQEGQFFATLAGMPLAKVQGFLLEKSKELGEEQKALRDKWKGLLGSAEIVNARAKEAGKRVQAAFEQALKEVGQANRRAAELLSNAWKAYIAIASASSLGEPSIPDVADVPKSRLDTMVSTAKDVARLYQDAYKSDETTLVVLGTTRDSVREFLEKTDLEVGLQRTAEARKNSESMAAATLTKGQQSDALALAYAGGKAIQAAMDAYEKSFNDFITEFRDIFVGPIGTKVLDQLLAGEFWESTKYGIERLDFESALKRYYDDAEDMWDIPLSGVDSRLQDAFKEAFRRELREYDDAVEGAIVTYRRAFQTIFIDGAMSKLKDLAGRSRGYDP